MTRESDTGSSATTVTFADLTNKQRNVADEISRILRNMKKDGAERKTQQYIHKHVKEFTELWTAFEQTHRTLTSFNQPEHKYFTQDFYGQVKENYDLATKLLKDYQDILDKPRHEETQQEMISDYRKQLVEFDGFTVSTEEQRLRFKKQNARINFCRKIINDATSVVENRSATYYEVKIQELTGLWANILQLHEEILTFATTEDLEHPYFKKNEFGNLETIYHELVIKLHEQKKENIMNADYGQERCDVKLPTINIPTFDGSYKMWTSFHDIYVRIIHHNKRIGDAEKMQYLKTSLKGEALKLIQHLISSDKNYEAAWELIMNRYDNKRILFSSYLDTLLSQSVSTSEAISSLKQLHDTTRECMHAISNLNIDISNWGPLVAHIIIKKLDKETHKAFEQSLKDPREIPQLDDVLNILETRFQYLEMIGETKRQTEYNTPNKGQSPVKKSWPIKTYHAKLNSCRYCNGQHNIYTCQKFRALRIAERSNFVKQHNMCMNCLNHDTKEVCHSLNRCMHCKQQHHSLLHQDLNNVASRQTPGPKQHTFRTSMSSEGSQRQKTATLMAKNTSNAFLATAIVRAKTSRHTYEYLRALVDPGSQATFITEEAAQMLGNPRTRIRTEISGMGESDVGISKSKIDMELTPRFPSNFKLRCEALVLSSLTKPQPDDNINTKEINDWTNVILADPTYDTPGPIDVIIGADIFGDILLEGVKKTGGGILAQRTELGWILSGRAELNQKSSRKIISMISCVDIDKQLKQFWELEETTSKPTMSEEDKQCEQHFQQTTKRNLDGTYTVHIPFKDENEQLGESRSRALARLYQVEKKFTKDKALQREYQKFMDEYLQLGHMRPVRSEDTALTTKIYYMPHQAVVKEESTTTKLRVVFDASTKTSRGTSLNDMMHNGPRLQQTLQDILLRWRKHQWVFSADIEKMYRQIKVATEHQNFQRILWRSSPNEKVQEFNLTTVTYGTKSAPYLAIKTLQRLAEDEAGQHPEAAEIILKDFYVDDLMSGTYTLQKAKVLQRDLIHVLRKGGFNLRKWKSNHKALLDNLPENLRDQKNIEINEGETVKTLGIHWNPSKDEFQFKVKLESSTITKRSILADIAKLFDPHGWLSPVIIKAKILLQELWDKGYSWDQPLEEDFVKKWVRFRSELHHVETITIPRWINYSPRNSTVELHGFCDASEKAYGAVIYIKTTTEYGKPIITLVTSKTKVAPLKKVTLPRLELCSAVLLTKLMQQTKTALEIEDIKVHAWTDSMITLAWISGKADRWNPFVSHRVAEIQQIIDPANWKHVRSEDNPADLASRGIDPQKLKDSTLWWKGPLWLALSEINWPKTDADLSSIQKQEEKKVFSTNVTPANDYGILSRFSSIRKLIRVLAYCNRFISKCKKEPTELSSIQPSTSEIQAALRLIIKLTQKQEFSMELRQLTNKAELSKKSKLVSLCPFIDNYGIIRVGGRVHNANISYDEKHPIIIPHQHPVTNLLIQESHTATLHGGNEATLAFIRRKYWIINGRSKVRQVLNKCVKCCRFKTQPINPIMGILPSPRVTPSIPFTHTGIDYAGPIQVKMSKLRNSKCCKGYIVIFVCLATKAIHIEVVTDMTSEAFLAAFKRFTARRGRPSCIYSDNGTTFVGAKKILDKELQKAINEINTLSETLSTEGIAWHFIPPAAPHFGGIWEAGVKSVKYHLKRIIGDTALNYEEITTLLYQIEACLNSRPLYPLTEDSNSTLVLTPSHFLIGKALVRPAEPQLPDTERPPLTRWKQIQKITQDFWKIWQREYLSRLQQRHKWQSGSQNITVGKLVLIKDETCSPTKWPLARIIETHPGTDGIVRVVTLRYKENSTIKRPVTKICLLPVEEDDLQGTSSESDKNIEAQSSIHTAIVKEDLPTTKGEVISVAVNNTTKKQKNTQRHPLRGRFLPIHSGWTSYISSLKRKNETPVQHSGTNPTKLAKIMLTTMIVLGVVQSGNSQYTIKYPEPGLYIEHIGRAMAKRGTLRIELNLPLNTTAEKERMNNIISKMNSTCKQSNRFAGDTHCSTLMEHLSDRRHAIISEIEILESKQDKIRSKRGLFGKLLQTVFGVNDEIYTDIETLEQNQQLLRQATNHQANIMLSMMTRINESEAQSIQKINLITKKLNNVITEVNRIEGWYDKIDGNKVGIQILAAYQLALDMFENIENHYIKLLEATLGRRSLLDFVTPSKLKDIISKAASKMPIHLRILSEPGPKLETSMNDTNIIIFGYLHIVEMDEYDLIKATPIPKRVKNNTYIAADISASLLATNFNTQQYFELTEEEFRKCIITEKHLTLCTPTVISNIETNANCIIDEIYQRHEKHNCLVKEFKTPKVIWKHLFMVNTWLFIADSPTSAAIKCNGNREDVILTGVGILQISQDCLIQTKKNTLYSEIHHEAKIKSTFVKPINLNVTWISNQQPSDSQMLELEPILKTSDRFFGMSHDSEKLLTSSVWRKIGPHATTATSSIGITVIIIIVIWNCKSRGWTQRIKNWKSNTSARVKNDAPLSTTNIRIETPDFTIHPCEYSTHTSRPFPISRQQPIYARPAECSQVNKTTEH